MKRLLYILLFVLIFPTLANSAIVWQQNFDGYTRDYICCLGDCRLDPGAPSPFTAFGSNTMSSPDCNSAVVPEAERLDPGGSNKRGYQITLVTDVFPTGENILKAYVPSNYSTFSIEWDQQDTTKSYTNFQKLMRWKCTGCLSGGTSGQFMIPEWQVDGGKVKMNLWSVGGGNQFFSNWNLTDNYTPGTWKRYEIQVNITELWAKFYVDGVLVDTISGSGKWSTGWYLSYFELGGNQYGHPAGNYIRYDNVKISDGAAILTPLGGGDTTPPVMSGASPTGTLACTSSVILQRLTNEIATCKYSTVDQSYDLMPNTFSGTGGTTHTQSLAVSCGNSYTYYVRCMDSDGNKNTSSSSNSFTVEVQSDMTPPVASNGLPTGSLGCNVYTRSVTLQATTNEPATCKYSLSNESYDSMPNTFESTGALSHSQNVNLSCGGTAKNYYVRCMDASGNKASSSLNIQFILNSPPGGIGTSIPAGVSVQ